MVQKPLKIQEKNIFLAIYPERAEKIFKNFLLAVSTRSKFFFKNVGSSRNYLVYYQEHRGLAPKLVTFHNKNWTPPNKYSYIYIYTHTLTHTHAPRLREQNFV